MFGLSVTQTRLLAAAVAAFLITAVGIVGADSAWVTPLQALVGAIAGALGWTSSGS